MFQQKLLILSTITLIIAIAVAVAVAAVVMAGDILGGKDLHASVDQICINQRNPGCWLKGSLTSFAQVG